MSDKDYEVGYKKPPKETQFKKGQSGNPSGRPKNKKVTLSEYDFRKMFLSESMKTIPVVEGDQNINMSKLEAMITQVHNKALAGDFRSIKLILENTDKMTREEDERNNKLIKGLVHNQKSILHDIMKIYRVPHKEIEERLPGLLEQYDFFAYKHAFRAVFPNEDTSYDEEEPQTMEDWEEYHEMIANKLKSTAQSIENEKEWA